jgi:hypothetical protein
MQEGERATWDMPENRFPTEVIDLPDGSPTVRSISHDERNLWILIEPRVQQRHILLQHVEREPPGGHVSPGAEL